MKGMVIALAKANPNAVDESRALRGVKGTGGSPPPKTPPLSGPLSAVDPLDLAVAGGGPATPPGGRKQS